MSSSRRTLISSAALLLVLAALITLFSVYHARHMGQQFLQYPLFLYGAVILALFLGGLITYLSQDKLNERQLQKLLSILPADERTVLKILFERREVEQKKLVTLSELHPVKVSRIISAFEQRGIVKKKQHGHTNLILLRI